MSALSTTASVVIREFTIRKIDMEIIFDVLNGNVMGRARGCRGVHLWSGAEC